MERHTRQAVRAPESRSVPRKTSAKVSNRLEEDAQEMEARLHQLRSNLLEEKQRLETERPAKYGGSRWRSASENRGSIRKYADEVQKPSNKQKPRQVGDAGGNRSASTPEANIKRANGATTTPTVLSVATVRMWTPSQVLQWLHMIGLDEFEGAFEFHQVDGKKLLSLSASDCAAFGVAKLSVRNRLFAGIESLRDRVSGGPRDGACADIMDPTLRDAPIVPEQQSSSLKHWSQLAPLYEGQVAAQTDQVPVNLADGQFNEEESHASFMKALLEWRSNDGDTTTAVEENQGSEWVNPMFNADDTATASVEEPSGGALLIGSYDEAQAHESFVQALEAWRRGGVEEVRRPATSECADSGCATSARKSCWQCYRVGNLDSLIADEWSKRLFCSSACRTAFHAEHARLYNN